MVAVRPLSLDTGFIGQVAVRRKLIDLVDAAKARHEMPGDILFTGPGGCGKTSLAAGVAHRLGAPFKVTMSTKVRTLPHMTRELHTIKPGMVWCLDEVHKVMPTTLLLLYSAIEDRQFADPAELGPVKLPSFTFVAATTDPQKFDDSFRGRFDLIANVTLYSDAELAEIVVRGAESLMYGIEPEAAADIARRSRGTAREALRLTRRARDQAQQSGKWREVITTDHVDEAMRIEGIDTLGLNDLDRRVLEAVAVHWAGTPIGIEPIVLYVGDNDARKSIQFLQRQGLLKQTKPGQVATRAAYEHLDHDAPAWRGGS